MRTLKELKDVAWEQMTEEEKGLFETPVREPELSTKEIIGRLQKAKDEGRTRNARFRVFLNQEDGSLKEVEK